MFLINSKCCTVLSGAAIYTDYVSKLTRIAKGNDDCNKQRGADNLKKQVQREEKTKKNKIIEKSDKNTKETTKT